MSLLSKRETRRRLLRGIADSNGIATQLALWFESPLGSKVLEKERDAISQVMERMFGYHILQIGGSEEHWLLDKSPISHKIIFSSAFRPGSPNPVADNHKMPLASDSIDAVVIHHGLDFSDDAHALLREATRVLRPGGQMVIIGFNPLSQWGLLRLSRRKLDVPWSGKFISKHRLLDWLQLLDLQLDNESFGIYFPPLNVSKILDKAELFEKLGHKISSPFGGAYFLTCVKQVAGTTPILPKWKPVRSRSSVIPAAETFRSKLH